MTNIRSLIIPVFITLALLWVFNRPISALMLFIYNYSGAVMNNSYESIKETQKDAKDIFEAQEIAHELTVKNRELEVENEKLLTQVKKLDEVNAALDFKKSFSYKTYAAKIIGRSPTSWHKQIIIDKGSNDGIKLGRGVLTENGIIGQIQKVGPVSSIVQLVFNPDWRMGVKISRLNKYGVLTGNHPEPAFLQFITVDSDVQVGDEIVTSGICIDTDNCPYPENFPVAKVISVSRDPNVVDLVVKVQFYENLENIREVFVLD